MCLPLGLSCEMRQRSKHAGVELIVLVFRVRGQAALFTLPIKDYCSKLSTFCFEALACASIAVEACCSIWFFARLVVSRAKSASSMPPRAADRLVEMLVMLETVWLRRLEIAPSSERCVLTVLIAASILVILLTALQRLLTSRDFLSSSVSIQWYQLYPILLQRKNPQRLIITGVVNLRDHFSCCSSFSG